MIDDTAMRMKLENMRRAAEEALESDSSFYEALIALKGEIDRDPIVQAAISNLQRTGQRVFTSFVPNIKIRVRTSEGVVSCPDQVESAAGSLESASQLIEQLKNATRAVIERSRHRHELDSIVTETVAASGRFEGIAAEIESAGYQVVICLDLSSYAKIRGSRNTILPQTISETHQSTVWSFSAQDVSFLKQMKIKV
jgi:hypothetical protein